MPRSGGIYTLPAGNPVISGTVITTVWANPTMADVAAALTQSLSRDGQTVPTANLPMATFKHTNVGKAAAANEYARADQVQDGSLLRCSGEANAGDAYTGALPFAINVFVNGQQIVYKFPAANTTVGPTLNINASAAWPILRQDGSVVAVGDCIAGVPSRLMFSDTSWLLLGAVPVSGGGGGVSSFNTRTGAVVLTSADIATALTYTPANKAGDTFGGPVMLPGNAALNLAAVPLQQVLALISSIPPAGVLSFNTRTGTVVLIGADVTAALGYTPLNKAGDTMGGALAMGNNDLTGVGQFAFNGVVDDGSSGVAKTIDFSAGNYHKLLMTGNCALTFGGLTGPAVFQVELTQDGTGNRLWSSSATIKWPASYAAADKLLSTAPGARDLLLLRWNGTDFVANLIKGIA